MQKLKLLLVYHSCDTMAAHAIFNAIGSLPDIQLRVLGPEIGWNPIWKIWHKIPEYKREKNYEMVSGKIFWPAKSCTNFYLFGLLREIRRFKPDIIHVMNEITSSVIFEALIIKILLKSQAKVLFFGYENLLDKKFKRANFLKKMIWNFSARHIDGGTYANSEGIRQFKKNGFLTNNIILSYWGIDAERYQWQNMEKMLIKYGIRDKFRIGFIGRITKEKGLLTILQAMRYLPSEVIFVVVGKGDYLSGLFEEAKKLNLKKRIIYFPWVDDNEVVKYFSLFDLFILPSLTTEKWKEQFGRAAVEAMMCRIPVIGSSSGAIPEIMGDAGIIFKEGNFLDLAQRINEYMQLSEEQKERRRSFCREFAGKKYSTGIFAQKIHDLYWKVLNLN